MITFDTNLLFYAVDPVAGDRHVRARDIIAQLDPRNTTVILQTLGELCFSVGRKRPDLLDKAYTVAEEMARTFHVAAAAPDDLHNAIAVRRSHGLQFWDAMLWSTADRAGCTILLSEDF